MLFDRPMISTCRRHLEYITDPIKDCAQSDVSDHVIAIRPEITGSHQSQACLKDSFDTGSNRKYMGHVTHSTVSGCRVPTAIVAPMKRMTSQLEDAAAINLPPFETFRAQK